MKRATKIENTTINNNVSIKFEGELAEKLVDAVIQHGKILEILVCKMAAERLNVNAVFIEGSK